MIIVQPVTRDKLNSAIDQLKQIEQAYQLHRKHLNDLLGLAMDTLQIDKTWVYDSKEGAFKAPPKEGVKDDTPA